MWDKREKSFTSESVARTLIISLTDRFRMRVKADYLPQDIRQNGGHERKAANRKHIVRKHGKVLPIDSIMVKFLSKLIRDK